MRKLLFLTLSIISLISFSAGIEFQKISLDDAKTLAKKENKIIFIDYYANWCGPCKWLSKNVFTDTEVGKLFNQNFINLKIDADVDNFIGREYNSSSLPTLLWIDHNGTLQKKVVGAIDKQTLLNHANYVLHPDTDPIAIKHKEFEKGKRDKNFMLDFAITLVEQEKAYGFLTEAYQKEYPTLDLKNSTDFTFFYLIEVQDNDEASMKSFLENFKTYYKKDETKGMALEKLIKLYVYKIEQDAEDKNEKQRDIHIEELIKFVEKNNIKEIEKDKIKQAFIAFYEESANK